jgi:hypothetical protein
MNNDRLLEILNLKLKEKPRPNESKRSFLIEVCALYMSELMEIGFIPFSCLDDLEEEIMETLEIFYRIKTYGSATHQGFKRNSD